MPPTYQERIRQKLTQTLTPILLEIHDDSARHAGHAGHDPRGETHFNVKIVSEAFAGLPAIARHRLVYDALKEEMRERVHALSLTLKTSQEEG